jgi:hypothetical protein
MLLPSPLLMLLPSPLLLMLLAPLLLLPLPLSASFSSRYCTPSLSGTISPSHTSSAEGGRRLQQCSRNRLVHPRHQLEHHRHPFLPLALLPLAQLLCLPRQCRRQYQSGGGGQSFALNVKQWRACRVRT